jgi:hypothetical protein
MLNVSKPALSRLSHKLAQTEHGNNLALRFTAHEGGWKLTPDRARSGDVKIAHDGRDVLLLDPAVSQAMTDFTLDVRRTDAGPRLRLHRREPQEE